MSDFDGKFEFELPFKAKKLILAYAGAEWVNINIPKDCNNLEIIMLLAVNYHYISNRKIDRLRKKRFDKIPDLHFKAHNNGIFKTAKPCYQRNFEPIKSSLDEIDKEFKLENEENKNDFKELNIGDTVKVPVGYTSDKIINTYYSICKHCTEKDYDKIIIGKVVNKKRRKFTLEIQIIKMPTNDTLIYRGKNLSIGSKFEYEMKYYNVIIDK